MNIAVDNKRISEGLVKKIHAAVKQDHNYVDVEMSSISRRVLKNLLDALLKSKKIQFVHKSTGCVYHLKDGTIAERSDKKEKLDMYRVQNALEFKINPSVKKRKGLFTDLPKVKLRVCTRKAADPVKQPMQRVLHRRYVTKYTFRNSRGYEYIISVSTPDPSTGALTLQRTEESLGHSEQQLNTFHVRYFLTDLNHSCTFHSVNALHLFQQCFNPLLQLALS